MDFYWRKEWTAPAIVGAVSFAAGVGAGIFVQNRRWQSVANEYIDTINAMHADMDKAADELVACNVPLLKDLNVIGVPEDEAELGRRFVEGVVEAVEDSVEPESDTKNVFHDPDWDVAEEMANRSPNAPYVIHYNEFFSREPGYTQITLEWYDGDKILADENNVPIYNESKVVGRLEFGRGSGDPNVVYIRNEELHAEYEIVRNPGSFQQEVMGLEIEAQAESEDLKHSHMPRKFRDSD